MATVASIMRYPVKGLNGHSMDQIDLAPGQAIQGDRGYAIRHGETVFDPAAPVHLPKTKFLVLMTHAKLAALQTAFDTSGHHLTLRRDGDVVFEGRLDTADGAAACEAFFDSFMGADSKGKPKLVTAKGHMFSDVPEKCLSVLNLNSVRALADHLGVALDPLRFRANIHIEGLAAWAERDWANGTAFTIGGVRFSLMKQIVRCNATNVNLETAEYDQNLPKTLAKNFGANLMGIYGIVEAAGTVRTGDMLGLG